MPAKRRPGGVVRGGLDGDLAAHRPGPVGRGAQRALEAGARHLEGVLAGDGVVLVEGPGDGPGGGGDLLHVGAARLVDGDAQHRTGLLEVEQLEVLGRHEGLDDGSDTLRDAHGQDLLSVSWRVPTGPVETKGVGRKPTPSSNCERLRTPGSIGPPRPDRPASVHPGVAPGSTGASVGAGDDGDGAVGVVARGAASRRASRRQRTVTLSLASSASPSVPRALHGMRAQPVAAASRGLGDGGDVDGAAVAALGGLGQQRRPGPRRGRWRRRRRCRRATPAPWCRPPGGPG